MRPLVSALCAAMPAVLTLLSPCAASGKTPAFDPREWQGAQAGPPTQVLTLGSPHLGQLDVLATPAMLAPLLDKLAAYKPDVITHEGISGEQCDTLKRFASRYQPELARPDNARRRPRPDEHLRGFCNHRAR